ncbi:hypothetical protein GCM10010919_12460 [Alishewanella longhuensis]|uniref:Polymer-forming cytoskeletal protein n=1 Tax=Alishewanella longhuensis TaxID=1091037 RepID=A0ABQ3L0M8_9ALTE|nr:polymer-forming cytoskeletal protein [Alishewanella longhuensis]GHG65255.1 hypothetical protein GCM10010919_12460 [Alishewanella longhuensis]
MGFFSNHATNQGKHAITTVIAEGCILHGSCRVSSDLQIDGELEGDVECNSTVIISSSGQMKGEISADKVIINGQFEGKITANNIEVLAAGKAHGVMQTDHLCIERGGSFVGETLPAPSQQQNLLLTEEQPPAVHQVSFKPVK